MKNNPINKTKLKAEKNDKSWLGQTQAQCRTTKRLIFSSIGNNITNMVGNTKPLTSMGLQNTEPLVSSGSTIISQQKTKYCKTVDEINKNFLIFFSSSFMIFFNY